MTTSVLVVESEGARREEMGAWLEDEGFDVLACPGPQGPGHVCVAATSGRCPLEESADVVILDMHLDSDAAFEGTPAWELLLFYLERGDQIVALSGVDDAVRPRSDEGVLVLQRPPDRRELVRAVRKLSEATVGGG
jgi:CheY-like chemotaxis protein